MGFAWTVCRRPEQLLSTPLPCRRALPASRPPSPPRPPLAFWPCGPCQALVDPCVPAIPRASCDLGRVGSATECMDRAMPDLLHLGLSTGCPVGRVPQQCGIPRGLTPGWGRSPGEGKWQPTPVFLPGGSPWTGEPGGLPSTGSQSGTTERLHVLSEGFFGDVYLRENTAGLHSSTSGSGERGTWWLFPRWSLSVLCTLQEEAFICVRRRRPGWLLAHKHQGCVATSRRCEKCGGRDGSPLPPLSRPFHVVVTQLPNHFSSSTAVPHYPRGGDCSRILQGHQNHPILCPLSKMSEQG